MIANTVCEKVGGGILVNDRPFALKFSPPIFINMMKHFPKITMAGLLKYFKPKQHDEDNNDGENPNCLPDLNGDLSKVVQSTSIEVTSAVVCQELEKEHGSHGTYNSLTPVQKYVIGQSAAENGVTATFVIMLKKIWTFN